MKTVLNAYKSMSVAFRRGMDFCNVFGQELCMSRLSSEIDDNPLSTPFSGTSDIALAFSEDLPACALNDKDFLE